MSTSMTSPCDLSHIASDHHRVRCWCCWQEDNDQNDPLIRVCQSCKDPDLQYIHQSCINRYVSSLPIPKDKGIQPNGNIPGDEHEALTTSKLYPSFRSIEGFSCARCQWPYTVLDRPMSIPRALRVDQPLWVAFLVLQASMILTLVSCSACFLSHSWWSSAPLFLLFGQDIQLWHLTVLTTLVSCLIYAHATITALSACSRLRERVVMGEPLQLIQKEN